MIRRLLLLVALIACGAAQASAADAGVVFRVSFPSQVRSQPVDGRLFLMISRQAQPEVRLQSTWFNSPQMVAVDVRRWQPGQKQVVDANASGTPLLSLRDLPPGDYYVQAVLNVYTEFHRADGRVVLAHMDQWEGQQFNRSPGNLHSRVKRLRIDSSGEYELELTEIIPPIEVAADTEWVKRVRIQSDLLTRFWGRPMYLGATVLLPRDYASNPAARYPVIYSPAGHFNLSPPFGFGEEHEFSRDWRSDDFPRVILITLLDPTPFADWSGGVNSANNGPYGDAIVTELLPYLETHFRIQREPSARALTGMASGGREALALQLTQPELFGGAWVFHPWAFEFSHYFTLDIHENDNAYVVKPEDLPSWARNPSDWLPVERHLARTPNGPPIASFRQVSQHDVVMAGMAGGDCIGVDDAIFSPVGADGYPKRLWDRKTGQIDRSVAEYWREHGDLAYYAKRNWPRIGPALKGKLHLFAGDADSFGRNYGVHAFEEVLRSLSPGAEATFEYGPLKAEWHPMTNAELVRQISASLGWPRAPQRP